MNSSISDILRDAIRTISEPIDLADAHLSGGAAIGIAAAPRDGTTAGNIMYRSSLALSHAKALGSGSYRFYEPRMGTAIEQAEALRRQLPAAIENGDVCPFLQPIVSLKTSDIVGFEILARWRHPTEGLISPARFLPLVEECGLSSRMFAKLLTRSCDIAMRWPRDLTLSVNVSPLELQDESLPDAVEHILADTGMPGHRLDIEITENALIDDSAAARSIVQRLRRLGVSFALDDFGIGMSSFAYLKYLPVDYIKIDGVFVRDMADDPMDRAIVEAINRIAHILGLKTVAEYVESASIAERLRAIGVDYAQGYFVAKPEALVNPPDNASVLESA